MCVYVCVCVCACVYARACVCVYITIAGFNASPFCSADTLTHKSEERERRRGREALSRLCERGSVCVCGGVCGGVCGEGDLTHIFE